MQITGLLVQVPGSYKSEGGCCSVSDLSKTLDLRCKGAAALKGLPVWEGGGVIKSPLPVLMQKYLSICIKNLYM